MGAIAGFLGFDKCNYRLEKMAKSLRYRLSNYISFCDEELELGFLQDSSQKLFEIDNYYIAFEGHIYNQEELNKTYKIDTDCVQDLIIQLYKKFGTEFFKELEGKFVFALFDKFNKKLFLIRDQIGERALYYWIDSKKIIFSSEIKAILQNNEVKKEVNLGSLEKYFTFSYVPSSETMIKGIFELLPANYLSIDESGKVEIKEYWDLISQIDSRKENTSEEELISELRYLLEDSVKKQIPNENENLGILLSGGIDSSLISALAQKFRKNQIHTYSTHFGEKYPNELYYSSMVAEHIKSNHKVIEIKPRKFLEELHHIIYCLDDPIGDPITVPNFILAREAKKDSSIILNGEGGDPCFGGPKNIPMVLSEFYSTDNSKYSREKYYLRSYKKCYEDLPYLLSENVLKDLKNNYQSMEEFLHPYFENERLNTFLDELMFLNIKLKGCHHILVKVDKMTSANKIDARAPLFSAKISQFSFKIPPKYKLNGRVEKFILKKAVEDILPHEVVYREKSGMMVPVRYWFQKDLKRFAKKVLSPKYIKNQGYFNPKFVKNLLDYNFDVTSKAHIGLKLWMLLTFEIWHSIFIENNIDI